MALAAAAGPGPALAAEGGSGIELRLRWEAFETPSAAAALDRSYDFGNGRLRLIYGRTGERLGFRAVLQAAVSLGLPEAGAFAIGPVLTAANRGDTDPSQVGIAELNLTYRTPGFRLVVGRQAYAEGLEVLTGVEHLDQVKRRRLAERLVGNWEWVNVGRRFDGLSFGARLGEQYLAGFALRPLAGGVNYQDAFEELDGLEVYGLSLTGGYGAWLPSAEVRLFALQYEDDRPGARAAAGGALSLGTVGASVLAGNERNDLLVWAAVQRGDWGPADQDAWAAIVEVGHRFGATGGAPAVRLGAAQASGDDGGRDHGTFFNLLPTNHKWYGTLDYSAFANLRNLYLEVLASLGERLSLRAAVHSFALVARQDAWYGGSGAFDEASLGFAARRPAAGTFASDDLGRELDLDLTWKFKSGLALEVGSGYFLGGAAAEEALPVEADGAWAYLQLSWTR